MKGYKVFNPDWTCLNFQYEVGKTYKHKGTIKPCVSGFHFCKELINCFDYYKFDPNNKVAEIEAIGTIVEDEVFEKTVTNEIKIVKELTWEEVLALCNNGEKNNGRRNCGASNNGNYNDGSLNDGRMNSGQHNYGNHNKGLFNHGEYNFGFNNYGFCNIGCNNYGEYNIGLFNKGHNNIGIFNTLQNDLFMFNKKVNIALEDIYNNRGLMIIGNNLRLTRFIKTKEMTDQEKEEHPNYKITNGYLKSYTYEEAWQNLWNGLNDREKRLITEIPNFDAAIFKEITSIDVEE